MNNQLQALYDLYNATVGVNWDYYKCDTNGQHWNFSQPEPNPCSQVWCGILCNLENTTIISINLYNYGLTGTLPPSLDQLLDLQTLNFELNKLSGTIPATFIKLSKLVSLTLKNNKLKGNLTDIFTNRSMLETIDISYNQFFGKVPQSFKTLPNIKNIHFTSNSLSGRLLDWLTAEQLKNLKILDLATNSFSGSFPNVSNVTSMISLSLKQNHFTGTLPDIFYHCDKVISIYLSYNHFIGEFPLSLTDTSSLQYFVADGNYFTQRLEEINWMNMPQLATVSIATNYLTGGFPVSTCRLKKLTVLGLGFNLLEGRLAIPDCQTNLYRVIYVLSLQANRFTGPLHEIFNTSRDHSFTSVSFSNNRLTGSIQADLFLHAPLLNVFAVGSNCLSGTIPVEICEAPVLQAFSIDGASTSENCRVPIVDIPSLGMNAFVTKTQIDGTIPECLTEKFRGPFLGLSGNVLTGTISSFPKTETLLLSHNRFTGTIPVSYYDRTWTSLDLSFNKFSGTFPSNSEINLISYKSDISLQENRISGTIPSIFQTTVEKASLNVLSGNMLSCSFNKKELPKNDPDYESYMCGSNIVNSSIYLWIIVFSFLTVFGVCWKVIRKVVTTKRKNPSSNEEEYEKIDTFMIQDISKGLTALFVENHSQLHLSFGLPCSPSLTSFFNYTLQIRRFSMAIVLFVFCTFLPVYATLGVYYRTYTERYAWTISAAFLSGTEATVVLIIFFSIFIVFSITMIHMMFDHSAIAYYNTKRNQWALNRINWKALTLWSIAWMINLLIMGTADSLYVYLTISRSTKYEFVIQILLALFKLGWHDIGLFRMVYHLKGLFQSQSSNLRKNEPSSLSFSFSDERRDDESGGSLPLLTTFTAEDMRLLGSEEKYAAFPFALTNQDIRYLTYMSIVNKVIIPCLAIFFISSSCFYNALVSQKPLSSTYSVCYIVSDTTTECTNILGSNEDGTSYTPAFTYSYQCSSAFLTDYVPVFVFMFLWSSVVSPLLVITMTKIYELFQQQDLWLHKKIVQLTKGFLPIGWGELGSEEIDRKLRGLILHRKQLLTLRISYTLAVLFVFGSLFPPLAIIAMIAVVNITSLEEYLTKQMLEQSSRSERRGRDYEAYLEEECRDIDRSVFKVMRLIILITCGSFGFLLFDVSGDRNGWSNGLIVMIVMLLFPLLVLWIASALVNKRIHY